MGDLNKLPQLRLRLLIEIIVEIKKLENQRINRFLLMHRCCKRRARKGCVLLHFII